MKDKKRFLRRKSEREIERSLEPERDQRILIKHGEYVRTLLHAFYLATYGKEHVRFEMNEGDLSVFVDLEVEDHEPKPFDDMLETLIMLSEPLLVFDYKLKFERFLDTLLEEDNDERVEELAAYYALMGGVQS
jgi:hypothetical protein